MSLPGQYKSGLAYFMDFEFGVTEHTFIPRPETGLLVEKTLETIEVINKTRLKGANGYSKDANTLGTVQILDLGTVSGNISISLTKYVDQCKITALDICHKALTKARKNALSHSVSNRVAFMVSDLFGAVAKRPVFDIIVSNPPYVSNPDMSELPPEVKAEPRIALSGGTDGLSFYRRIITECRSYLEKGGFLIMEMGYNQSRDISLLLEKEGLSEIEAFKDYSDIDRIIRAKNV